jgi:hypothetical protein
MKMLFFVVTVFCISIPLLAQDETLFGTDDISIGLVGGVAVKPTNVQKTFGLLVGGYGGILLNHQLMIGAGGFGLVNNIGISDAAHAYYQNTRDLFLEIGYGGGIIEYTFAPSKLIHATAMVLIGAGGITYSERNMNHRDYFSSTSEFQTDAFFVIEPSVNAEMNLTNWMRVSIGGGYRFVTGVNYLVGLNNDDLRSASGNLTFKFGKF